MADVQLYKDNLEPPLEDTFTLEDGTPFAFPGGSTLKFSMRLVNTNTLTIDHEDAVIVDDETGEVKYDWQSGDTDTAGEYVGWWTITFTGGRTQDSSDITISIGTHDKVWDPDGAFVWPNREFQEAVSLFDWGEIAQERFVLWSRGVVSDIYMETGRNLAYFEGLAAEDPLRTIGIEVWSMLLDQRYVKRRDDVMESEYDDTYSSFTAGSYSESKPSLKDRNPLFARMVNSSPEIARKLWHLMTEEKKDEVRALSGEIVPAEYLIETDWFEDALGSDQRLWWNE